MGGFVANERGSAADGWLVGVVASGGALSGLRVDGGWLAAGPTSARPTRVHVRLRFTDQTATGFPTASESASLLVAEDQVVASIGVEGVLVAAVTVPGFRDLVFHTAGAARCRERLATTDPASLGYSIELDADDDPGWSWYRSMFTDAVPADADRRRIVELARNVPGGSPVCALVHRFRFPSLREADQAAAALRSTDIAVVFAPSDDVAAQSPPVLEARETEMLTQAEMARSRDALAAFATSWNGTYEGWLVDEPTTES